MLFQFAGWLQGSGTGTAAVLRREEKAADQPSRLRSLGPTARRVNGEQASRISGDKVVIAEG